MSERKTVLVLGGGIGGIAAASLMRKRLPRGHRVILVERESQHVFPPSLLWLMVGDRRERQISRPIASLAGSGIELVQGEIDEIDPLTRRVRAGGRDIHADYIVIALGAELAPETIPGLAEAGHNVYTLPGPGRSIGRAPGCIRDASLC